jgi:hypothetical protein
MTRLTITTNGKVFARKLTDFANEIPRAAKAKLYGRMVAARKRISHYPAMVVKGSLPKNWFKSDKQRRKVFALLREGKIPYQRTGKYMDAWQIENVPNGYRLITRGPRASVAKWISGDAYGGSQAKIHQGRWAIARDVAEEEIKKLPREIADEITMVARRRGL